MNITITKEQHINELLGKINGKPDRDSVRADYPGLSMQEAVELKILLMGCTEQQATEAIENSRLGAWRE